MRPEIISRSDKDTVTKRVDIGLSGMRGSICRIQISCKQIFKQPTISLGIQDIYQLNENLI